MTQPDDARARELCERFGLVLHRVIAGYRAEPRPDVIAALTAAFAEVRRQQAERDARLVEKHAHGMAHGVFMRMAERFRSLAPEPPNPTEEP